MPGRRQLAALVVAIAFGAPSLAAGQTSAVPPDASSVPRVSQDDFRQLVAARKVFVVDVRTAVSFMMGHIPDAVSVPLDEVHGRADEILTLAGDKAIVTYCSCPDEHTAAEAGLMLIARRKGNVLALAGGYIDWVRRRGRVERSAGDEVEPVASCRASRPAG